MFRHLKDNLQVFLVTQLISELKRVIFFEFLILTLVLIGILLFYIRQPWSGYVLYSYCLLIYFFLLLASLLGSSLPYWSTGLITQFLDLSQAVGFLGRVINSSQGLYLNTGQHKHRKTGTHIKHRCPRRDSNSQSRPPSDRRLLMPPTGTHILVLLVAYWCVDGSLCKIKIISCIHATGCKR
jgi:hypothetical protein